jgi:hypothetical protein
LAAENYFVGLKKPDPVLFDNATRSGRETLNAKFK